MVADGGGAPDHARSALPWTQATCNAIPQVRPIGFICPARERSGSGPTSRVSMR